MPRLKTDRYLTKTYNGISVSYAPDLDGGGTGFGQDYIPVVRRLFGRVGRVFEFCAGPAFIGFSLLGHGLCRSLCLSDINQEAVDAAHDTVKRNGLENVVSVYCSDALDQIPRSETWDLVVANPPHFKDQFSDSIHHHDPGWGIHRKFYAGVKPHLPADSKILIQENFEGSDQTEFRDMIAAGGLRCDGSFMWADRTRKGYLDTYYFILSRQSEDVAQWNWKSNLIDCSEPATILEVELFERATPEIRIEPFRRHRFQFLNRFDLDVSLLVFKTVLGVPRFLRTLPTSQAGAWMSPPFHFYPGRYVLKDEKSRRPLLRITSRG